MIEAEVLYIIIPPLFWFLWSAGGKHNKVIRHNKLIRKVGIPLCIFTVCLLMKVDFIIAFIASALSFATYTLPYGNTKDWWWRIFVGFCYTLALLPLGYSPVLWAIPVVFVGTFWLSRKFNWFTWKIAEGLTSLAISISLIALITK